MELKFNFQNDVYAVVLPIEKRLFAYYIDYRYDNEKEVVVLGGYYNNDDEMLKLLKTASEYIVIPDYEEAVEIIFNYYEKAKISYREDGTILIGIAHGMLPVYDEDFVIALKLLGYKYWHDSDNNVSYIEDENCKHIAQINWVAQYTFDNK